MNKVLKGLCLGRSACHRNGRPPAWAHLRTLPLGADVVLAIHPRISALWHEGNISTILLFSSHVEHTAHTRYIGRPTAAWWLLIFSQTWAMDSVILSPVLSKEEAGADRSKQLLAKKKKGEIKKIKKLSTLAGNNLHRCRHSSFNGILKRTIRLCAGERERERG